MSRRLLEVLLMCRRESTNARSGPALVALCLLACGLAVGEVWVTIRNADFEALDAAGKSPASWQYIDPMDGEGALTADDGRQGGHCAQVTCTRLTAGWGPGFGQSGVVSVEGDRWYEVRFWARAEGLTGGAVVALRDTTHWDANRLWRTFFPGVRWREYRFRFPVTQPLPAAVSRFQFSFDSTGSLWVDDVSLVETVPEPDANVLDVAGRKNLLPNGSFEMGAFGWATYGADELFGDLDTTTAADGKHSFRLALEPAKLPVYYNDFTYALRSRASHDPVMKLPVCPIGYCPVEKGKPVCFSFAARGSRPGVPIVANVTDGSGKATAHTFVAGAEWARFSFAATPQSSIAFVTLGTDADAKPDLPVTLWVDALQLELGDTPTDYEPTFPVECALDTGHEGNTYLLGEAVTPELTVCNHSGTKQQITVAVEVEDFFGKREKRLERRLSVSPNTTLREAASLGVTEPGFYRFHLSAKGDGRQTSRTIRAALIYPFAKEYPNADGFLGVNHAFVSDLYMRRAKAMGVTWVRSWFCKWEDVEHQQGTFDFSEADTQCRWIRQHGMNVELCLSDPASEWASTAPSTLSGSTGNEAQSPRVWWQPERFGDYEHYVREVASHFKGRVHHYEVFNEPVNGKGGDGGNLDLAHTYPTFLQHAGKAIRSVSPENKLLGAGLGYFADAPDLSPIVARIDLLSEHRYPRLAPTAGMLSDFRRIHERLRAAGGDRPLWMTEYGVYADDDPDPTTADSRFLEHCGADSEKLAATYVAKHHVIALASGFEKVFFHIGNWPFVVNREHGCGFHAFFEWGGVPRKTYVALNTLAYLLPPGTRHVRTWTGPSQLFAFEFERPRGHVTALWAEGGLTAPAAGLRALNASGATFANVAGGRLTELPPEVEDSPLYLSTATDAQRQAVEAFLRTLNAEEAPAQ
ncbi:MAG: hypothetical protein COZ57_08080 [Armatimonadetes bacterium CG_4_8_14_3_um_filter_66_20]|nr:MAG: hypothetical protein COZ57_08080 [Armatimonadetes bacterium CG_4_8_14_3_um_filter_66_20]